MSKTCVLTIQGSTRHHDKALRNNFELSFYKKIVEMMSKRQHQQLLKAGTPSASTDDPQAFDRLPSLPSAHTFVAKFSPRIGGPANKLFIAIVLLLTLFVDSMEAAITGEMESYPENRLTEILNSVPSFDSVEQEEASQRLVNMLSLDDQQVAARTSYAFWYASKRDGTTKDCLSPTIQRNMAMREARRHLVGAQGNNPNSDSFDKALETLRGSIEYRKEHKIDLLRLCFLSESTKTKLFANEDEKEQCERYQALLEEELPKQLLAVRGKDRGNRPILVYMSRTVGTEGEFDTEAFVLTRLYVLERANAATEFLSSGAEEKLMGVFRTGGYQQAHMPPMAAIKQVVSVLQSNYPERLEKFIMLDPPFWMRSIFAILRYFLDEDTAGKIMMVSGGAEREGKVTELVSTDQAMPFLLPDGELTTPIDPMYYLHEVPFYCLYDECNNANTTGGEEVLSEGEAINVS